MATIPVLLTGITRPLARAPAIGWIPGTRPGMTTELVQRVNFE